MFDYRELMLMVIIRVQMFLSPLDSSSHSCITSSPPTTKSRHNNTHVNSLPSLSLSTAVLGSVAQVLFVCHVANSVEDYFLYHIDTILCVVGFVPSRSPREFDKCYDLVCGLLEISSTDSCSIHLLSSSRHFPWQAR